jgi:hypothetical protein
LSKGPVLTRVQALPCAPRSGQRPAAAVWLVARDISQRARPNVRPITPCSLCIYCGDDAPPATMLTSDVLSQHLMCPIQSAGRRRQGRPADGTPIQSSDKQYARAERHTELIIPSARSLPCTPKTRRSRVSGHKKIAPAANVCSPKCYVLYVPGLTCRGSGTLCMPPSAIKGEACDVTRQIQSQAHSDTHKFIQALKQYITQWSRVLRSGGPNHSKSLCVLVFSSQFPTNKQNA